MNSCNHTFIISYHDDETKTLEAKGAKKHFTQSRFANARGCGAKIGGSAVSGATE